MIGIGIVAMVTGLSALGGSWRVAAHAERIEPILPISMAGSMSDQLARRIHDPIHVRCILFDNESTSLAFVLCDSCMIERAIVDEAKRRIEEETGISADRVTISATHSHSCPTSARVFRSVPDAGYQEQLIERIVTSVATTQLRLEPARVGFARASCHEEVFNRRWEMKPGGIGMNPFGGIDLVQMNPPVGSADLVEPAGPIDPEVPLIWAKAADGEPIGLMANYALHYVGGVPGGEISSDYFGEFSRMMGERWRPKNGRRKPVALLTNGASGDINNINFRSRDMVAEPFGQIRRVADRVASRSLEVLEGADSSMLEPNLGAASEEVELGVRLPTEAEVQRAEQILKEEADRPGVTLAEVYALETKDLSGYPPRVKLCVQVARLGSVGVVALPCEVFVEVGLEIKKKSPFPHTVIIELANGYNGYLPTPAQHELGGYETWRAKSSYLEKDASVKLVEASLRLLASLAKGSL
jgi:hypothetical protein